MPPFPKVTATAVRDFASMNFTQLIRSITVTPEPNAVRIDFTTALATLPIVEIFSLVRDPAGQLVFNLRDVKGLAFDLVNGVLGNAFTEHHARIVDLDQGTLFSYRITAGGIAGPPAVATGSFRTGRRSGNVFIREIQVWNDGDPGWFGGTGELDFSFGLYDDNGFRVREGNYAGDLDSGQLVVLPFGGAPLFSLPNGIRSDSLTMYVLGREFDRGFLGAFAAAAVPPPNVPEHPTHGEDDREVRATALQRLDLPTLPGDRRLTFSLNSGPWGIHYVINGWIDVHVTNPPAMFTKSLGTVSSGSTTMVKLGALQAVTTAGGKSHLFQLGPNGVVLERLSRGGRGGAPKWAALPTQGAESVTIVVRDEQCVELVSVRDGVVRAARHKLRRIEAKPLVWTTIGEEMQSGLTALQCPGRDPILVGLTRTGGVRVAVLRDRAGEVDWKTIGGSFVGSVAAIATEHGAELFAVTGAGEVEYVSWRPDEQTSPSWRSLGDVHATHVTAVQDDSGQHLFALTPHRTLAVLARRSDGFTSEWQHIGTLDELAGAWPTDEELDACEPAPEQADEASTPPTQGVAGASAAAQ